jgi:hypothetical protein
VAAQPPVEEPERTSVASDVLEVVGVVGEPCFYAQVADMVGITVKAIGDGCSAAADLVSGL